MDSGADIARPAHCLFPQPWAGPEPCPQIPEPAYYATSTSLAFWTWQGDQKWTWNWLGSLAIEWRWCWLRNHPAAPADLDSRVRTRSFQNPHSTAPRRGEPRSSQRPWTSCRDSASAGCTSE